MKTRYFYLFLPLFVLISLFDTQASGYRISGFVKDKQSNEVLIGANVRPDNLNAGTTTDNNGFFSLKLNSPCNLVFSYIGFSSVQLQLDFTNDTLITVYLSPDYELKEVTVTAKNANKAGVTRLSARELEMIPMIGGKPDVMKAIQLLPGVLSQSEGMSLILVRGGEPGQNLYLLDNVPLIYVNHLGGFSSVFNPDIINSVDMYKSNFPAKYGGKLSSIVDITQREGDVSKTKGSFSLGLLDATLTLEGPLVKGKMSYLITLRKTLIESLMALTSYFASTDESDGVLTYGFHDVNAKLTWKPNDKNVFNLNFYQGSDYINLWSHDKEEKPVERNHILQAWGNVMASGRWKRVFGSKLHSENIVSVSRYSNRLKQDYSIESDFDKFENHNLYRASVTDFSIRTNWKYELMQNWKIELGGLTTLLKYEPYYFFTSPDPVYLNSSHSQSVETSVYADNKISVGSFLTLQPSLRFVHYKNTNSCFNTFEPRINLEIKLPASQLLNLNYQKVTQNSHLVFAQGALFRQEIWLPASATVPPQICQQLSLSLNGTYGDGKFSSEINAYYKKMNQLTVLKEGYENMVGLQGIENKLETNGEGLAYGTELILRKNTGKWTGYIGYTWSVANRRFSHINGGVVYEYDFNRPHSVVVNLNRPLKHNWNMNLVWVYQSGNPFTPALAKLNTIDFYNSGHLSTEILYGTKNSARTTDYHRLDIGFNHTVTTRKGKKAVWTYSLYNAYNHVNPYGFYYDNNRISDDWINYNKPLKLYKASLFNFIPSIAYKYFF